MAAIARPPSFMMRQIRTYFMMHCTRMTKFRFRALPRQNDAADYSAATR
jgi:hypothetical protein